MQVDNETSQAADMMPMNNVVEISDHMESEDSSNSPHVGRVNKKAPLKKDSQVTDEKLFMESTGFGEPKVRTADYIDDDEPEEEKRSEEFKVAMENLQNEAHAEMIQNDSQPFFSKRQNSQGRQQDEQSFATRDQFYPLATTGFQDQLYQDNLLRNNVHRPEQSRTHTTLGNKNQKLKTFAPLPPSLPNQSKRNEKSRLSVKASGTYQQLRYLSQPRGTMKHSNSTGQPLPSLVKPSQQNNYNMKHSRSNSNMPRSNPIISTQNQHSSSPSKLNAAKKVLQQKLQIVQAYGKTGQNQFVSKGAFGGALQQIVLDKITSMREADEVPASFQNSDLVNDKGALKRKQRLNQILNAAQRGHQKQVSPNIDVEDVAHQYHNLKIKYNQVKDENYRMNTKLTKMQRQASQRDEQLMALNQELLDLRNDRNVAHALSHPYEVVQQEKKQNLIATTVDQSQLNTGNDSSIDNELGTINQESKFVIPQPPMMSSPTNASYKIRQSSSNAKLEQSSIVMTLKKLITTLQKKNEAVNLEMNDLKKSTKVCVYNELDIQLEAYSDECKRLRDKLEQAELKIIDTDKQLQDLRQVKEIKQHQEIRDQMKFKEKVEDIHEKSQEDEDQLDKSEFIAVEDEAKQNDEENGGFTIERDTEESNKEQLNNIHLTTDQTQNNEADEQQDAINAEEELKDEPVEILVESKPLLVSADYKKQQLATAIGYSSFQMSKENSERPFWGKIGSNASNNNNNTVTNKFVEKNNPPKQQQQSNKLYRNETISSEKRQNPLSSVQSQLYRKQEIKNLTQKAKIKQQEHESIVKVLRKTNQTMLNRIRDLEKALKVKLANDDIAIINSQKEPQQHTRQKSQLRQKTPKKAKPVAQRRNKQSPSKSPTRKASQSASATGKKEQEKVAKTTKKSTRKSTRNNQNQQKLEEEKKNQQLQLEEVVVNNQNKSVEVSENYSNHSFDEDVDVQQNGLLIGDGDVSTEMEHKPASETGVKHKEDDGYSSIEDENAAMEDEVEKQFYQSIKSAAKSVISQQVQENSDAAMEENVVLDEEIKSQYSQKNKQSVRSSASVKPFVEESIKSPEQIVEEQARALSEEEPKSRNADEVTEEGLVQSEKTEFVEPLQKTQENANSQKSDKDQKADEIVEDVELPIESTSKQQEQQFQLDDDDDSKHSIEQQYEQQLPENTLINVSQRSIQSCAETPQKQELLYSNERVSEKIEIQEGNKNNDLQEIRDIETKQHINTSETSAQKQEKKENIMNAFRQSIIAQFNSKKEKSTLKFPSMIPTRENKEEISETTMQQIQQSPNDEGNEKQGEALPPAVPVIEQDVEAVTQKTGKAKSAESDNMLVNIDESKQPIEGQSCGRNEDSEINSLNNPESAHNEQQDKQVGEEQMLDIAENILRLLAEKLLDAQWSVDDVFNHPKLVHSLPEYENQKDVVAISAENFLGRMYQLGFQEITQLQVACMMRVLGKGDINNAILFDDLIALLENYGVPAAHKKPEGPETESPEAESPEADSPEIESPKGDGNQGDVNEAPDQASASQASEKDLEKEQKFDLQADGQDQKLSKKNNESQRSYRSQQQQSQKADTPNSKLENQKQLSQQQDESAPAQTQDQPQQSPQEEPQDEQHQEEQPSHLEEDKQKAEEEETREQEPEMQGEEVKVESQYQEADTAPKEQEEQSVDLQEKVPAVSDTMKEMRQKISQALLEKLQKKAAESDTMKDMKSKIAQALIEKKQKQAAESDAMQDMKSKIAQALIEKKEKAKIEQITATEEPELKDDGVTSSGGVPPFSSAAKAEGSFVEEEQKVVISSAPSGPPIQRKATRKDSILQRVRDQSGKQSPYSKMRDHISNYSSQVETLMDIFKARSYKQNIKSKSRQSETLVIQKSDFFEMMNSMQNNQQQQTQQDSGATVSGVTNTLQFSDSETKEIEKCVQLTPKFPTMYAIRHIEHLFEALLDTFDPDSFIGQEEDLINGSSLVIANQTNSLTPIREEVSNQ